MTTTPNVDLLRQTMDEILAHPEQHNQSRWAIQTDCGTAYCFAGWACKLSGLEADFANSNSYPWEAAAGISHLLSDGTVIAHEAARLLGLNEETADTLFAACNTTADLKHYVDEIAEHGRIREAGR